ncbi:hypothetical protein [Aestuariicoccus sp. MJ-SS9]|uniref:hypothetical protein n=1 Tax=Aestuariicoccus sp. MJ-SS9 TaxID=3079855 RepID=UPI0029080B99|nr:hypothetical protein [Aestuariicoccus sp. MJ-SS9]MDU8912804.1 hypothetical protein [Aestuariicoccus sp. MJ-SS9]
MPELFHTPANDADYAAHLTGECAAIARLLGAWAGKTLAAFVLWKSEHRHGDLIELPVRRAHVNVIGV